MMKGLVVERVKAGPQVRYGFSWRGVPEHVPMDKLVDLFISTWESFEWEDPPAIALAETDKGGDFKVILTW